MPKTITTSTEVYEFDELSDDAKEKAREWFREGNPDYDWWDHIFTVAHDIGAVLGFDISEKDIHFSGFSSQGDGASFSGSWSPPKAPVANMRKLGFSGDTGKVLLDMARDAWAVVRSMTKDEREEAPYTVAKSHRYHNVTCEHDGVQDLARDFASWIYKALNEEYDYQNSDEVVDENIRANEYTFTVNGKRYW